MTNPYQAPTANVDGDKANCKSCGNEVLLIAAVCPHCGVAQRSRGYKNKNLAGLLAMLLGAFGVHRFYLGQWWGIFYLLLFWTGIPSLVSFFEAIVMWCRNVVPWDIKYNEGRPAGPHEKAGAGSVAILVIVIGFVAIAVIGILAAIAIPAYSDYTVRARVIEALSQSASVRTDIISFYDQNNTLPRSNGDIGQESPMILASGHRVDVIENGYALTFAGDHNEIVGKSIIFEPYRTDNDTIDWDCTGGDLPNRFRPSRCRAESQTTSSQ